MDKLSEISCNYVLVIPAFKTIYRIQSEVQSLFTRMWANNAYLVPQTQTSSFSSDLCHLV